MSNVTSKQILEEGPRNAVVKLAGVLDTANVALSRIITLSDFTNNDRNTGALIGLRMDYINYSSGPDLVTSLFWHSSTPVLIASFAQSDELDFTPYGGANPDMTVSGFDGAIDLVTSGLTAGSAGAFTVILRMVKLYRP